MKSDDVLLYFLIYLFAFLIVLLIFYRLIRSANDTDTKNKIQLQNQQLLAMIAAKQGVNDEDIKKVIQGENYKAPEVATAEVKL